MPSDTGKIWTVLEILNWSSDFLSKKKVEDSRTVVEWLLCHVLSCSRMELYLCFDRPLSDAELNCFRPMLRDCAAYKPVQQVLGQTEFYGLVFFVNEHVLIPRPETERLVEAAIEQGKNISSQKRIKMLNNMEDRQKEKTDGETMDYLQNPDIRILDIGAGSGCVSIALAKYLPQGRFFALEKSREAVSVLQKNIKFHGLDNRFTVLEEDIMTWTPQDDFDMIVSNPPYISSDEIPGLDMNVGYYEPIMALSDKGDGLGFYRRFAELFSGCLTEQGAAVLEIGGNHQSDMIRAIFEAYNVEIRKDYQQDDRIAIVARKVATDE